MAFHQLVQGDNFSPSRKALYYSHRLLISPFIRNIVINTVRKRISQLEKKTSSQDLLRSKEDITLLGNLNRNGFCPLPSLLSASQVNDIRNFLHTKQVAEYKNTKNSFYVQEAPENVKIADHFLSDIIECPHIVALANHPTLLNLAQFYIGCKPTISLINLRWSFPQKRIGTGIQAFHRDYDDWRFIKVFFYLTDVDETSGPHVYVSGTHQMKATFKTKYQSDESVIRRFGTNRQMMFTGEKGYGFAVDTFGIHKGLVPISRPRLLLQIQYSLLPVFAYAYQPHSYSGLENLDPYINRLFLSFNDRNSPAKAGTSLSI